MGVFGDLVHAVAGAIASVANAVVNALSPVVESGGVIREIAGEVSDVAKSVLGASTEVADFSEDREIDDEEAEELIEDAFKLLVGAHILMFGSGSGKEENDNTDTFDDDWHIPIQVTDGLAVTYDKNGDSSEPKSVWDCFVGAKEYFSNLGSQAISNIEEEWSEVKDKHIIWGGGIVVDLFLME